MAKKTAVFGIDDSRLARLLKQSDRILWSGFKGNERNPRLVSNGAAIYSIGESHVKTAEVAKSRGEFHLDISTKFALIRSQADEIYASEPARRCAWLYEYSDGLLVRMFRRGFDKEFLFVQQKFLAPLSAEVCRFASLNFGGCSCRVLAIFEGDWSKMLLAVILPVRMTSVSSLDIDDLKGAAEYYHQEIEETEGQVLGTEGTEDTGGV